MEQDKVCSTVPQQCGESKSFIVDLASLLDSKDITGDDNRAFFRPATRKTKVHTEDGNVYVVRRRFYSHKGTTNFKRDVYEILDENGNILRYAMLQYRFLDGVEKSIVYTLHGNCKKGGAFMPRRRTVTTQMKKLSETLPPAKVVSTLLDEQGGAEKVTSVSSTPRGGQQARNVKRRVADPHRSRSGPAKSSDFGAMLKLSTQGDFVRSFEISKGGHPRAFCSTQQQLHDVEKYCTGENGALLQIDPTFSIGSFYLTCTTFRHPKFENADNDKEVLMPGPYMMHASRTEEDYEYLARHMSNALKNKTIRSCGTDGEKAIMNGFRKCQSFRESTWLICMIHARENCQRKMTEIGIGNKTMQKISRHIYGIEKDTRDGRQRRLGLVDAESEQVFDDKLNMRMGQWDTLEQHDTSKDPVFSQWFLKYKAEECKTTMLAPTRRVAGEIPRQFTTNDVECANLKVKRQMDWAKKSWDQAANHLQKLVLTHYDELIRAIYKEGKFKLAACHKQHELEPYEWPTMDMDARRKHLQKAGLKLVPIAGSLSILPEESGITGYPLSLLNDVCAQASILISEQENIVQYPTDPTRYVIFDKDVAYNVHMSICDIQCSRFKTCDRFFCEHTIAVAKRCGSLTTLLGKINSNIQRKIMETVNATITESCRHAGEKAPKRKGRNNTIAKRVTTAIDPAQDGGIAGPADGLASANTQDAQAPPAMFPMAGTAYAKEQYTLPPLTPM